MRLLPFRDSSSFVGPAAPRSIGFAAVQRDPCVDKRNSSPSGYGKFIAQHCGQGCQSEEAFGFFLTHRTPLSFNICSDLSWQLL